MHGLDAQEIPPLRPPRRTRSRDDEKKAHAFSNKLSANS